MDERRDGPRWLCDDDDESIVLRSAPTANARLKSSTQLYAELKRSEIHQLERYH